jgi:hypothetical protein
MANDEKDGSARMDTHETPHDAYVRVVLIHPGLLGAQVRAVLPEAVWKLLELDEADAKSARFIDERLKAQESDAVFEVSSASGDVKVFVLLEHQRTAPWHMPLRVLRYLTAFWHSKFEANPSARRLPLVIPLVVANVPGGWRGARSLSDLLDGPPELVAALKPFLPHFELVIDDLSQLDVAKVLARPGPPGAHLMWWALSVSTDLSKIDREATAMLPTMRAAFEQTPGLFLQTATYLQSLPMSDSGRQTITTTFELIPIDEYRREHPEKFIDVDVELGRFLGWVHGRREGREHGREEGRRAGLVEAMMAIWPARFGAPASDEVRARLEQADTATLTRWLVQAQTARAPGDVFAEP